ERRHEMVSGAVAPARLDLANPELLEAHLHSLWLAETGRDLKNSIEDVLDLEVEGYPLREDVRQRLVLSPERQERLRRRARELLESLGDAVLQAPWYAEGWVERGLA